MRLIGDVLHSYFPLLVVVTEPPVISQHASFTVCAHAETSCRIVERVIRVYRLRWSRSVVCHSSGVIGSPPGILPPPIIIAQGKKNIKEVSAHYSRNISFS